MCRMLQYGGPTGAMRRTLLMIKPDAYLRDLEKAILDRVTAAGIRVVRSARRRLSREELEALYAEHRGKTFFEKNVDFLSSGEVGLFILAGDGDVAQGVRRLVGNKDPRLAEPGSIRGDFGIDRQHAERTLVHASASAKEAEREIALLFGGQANPKLRGEWDVRRKYQLRRHALSPPPKWPARNALACEAGGRWIWDFVVVGK